MNSTNNNDNNLNPLTVDEINSLSGEELTKALDERLQQHNRQMTEIDNALKPLCEAVEKMPDVDEKKNYKEDSESIAKIENQLNTNLNNAVLNLATTDEILKDVNETE